MMRALLLVLSCVAASALSGQRCTTDDRALRSASLEAVARLGEGSSDPIFELSGVRAMQRSGDELFIIPEGEAEVRVYAVRGTRYRRIGRRGSGPGDFQSPSALGTRGDSLWVIDGGVRRLSVFTRAGQLVRSAQTVGMQSGGAASRTTLVFAMPQHVFTDGTMLGLGGYLARDVASGRVTTQALLHLSSTGGLADTIGAISLRNTALILRGQRRTQYRIQPYQDGPLVMASRSVSRVFLVDRAVDAARVGQIRVVALGLNGDTVWQRVVAYAPVRVPSREIDSVQRSIEGKARAEFAGAVAHALYRPAFRVPVSAIVSTGAGGLWLRRSDRGEGARVAYLEMNDAGRPTRCIDAAPGVDVLWVDGDEVWGVEIDADDVPRIARFAVRSAQ
jgi:hypothetical protein